MPNKPLVALQRMNEFDPECERHHPLLIIKEVDPGCTTELQIELCRTGYIIRLSTTEDPEADDKRFEEAILAAFRAAWKGGH